MAIVKSHYITDDPAAKRLHHDAVGCHGGIQLLLAHLLENPHAANLVTVPGVGIHHTLVNRWRLQRVDIPSGYIGQNNY